MKYMKWLVIALVIVVISTFAAFTWFSLYLGREGLTVLPSSQNSSSVATDTKLFTSATYGFSFSYPSTYSLSDSLDVPYAHSLFLTYAPFEPGFTRGISLNVFEDKKADARVSEMIKSPGYSRIGADTISGVMWQMVTFDPAKDPSATDQDRETVYVTEHNNRTYEIRVDKSKAESLSESKILKNSEALIRSWKFL